MLREASAADIPAIQAIAHAAWPVAYAGIISPAQIAYMLEMMYGTPALEAQFGPKGHRFLLALREDGPIGFAAFEHHPGTRKARLHKLYVLPAEKGSGLGRRLLEAVLAEVKRAGAAAIELNVNKRNPAKDFYARNGFTIAHDVVIDIGSGFVMDDHVMVRDLDEAP